MYMDLDGMHEILLFQVTLLFIELEACHRIMKVCAVFQDVEPFIAVRDCIHWQKSSYSPERYLHRSESVLLVHECMGTDCFTDLKQVSQLHGPAGLLEGHEVRA